MKMRFSWSPFDIKIILNFRTFFLSWIETSFRKMVWEEGRGIFSLTIRSTDVESKPVSIRQFPTMLHCAVYASLISPTSSGWKRMRCYSLTANEEVFVWKFHRRAGQGGLKYVFWCSCRGNGSFSSIQSVFNLKAIYHAIYHSSLIFSY